jgi:hypothetical protein
MSPNYSLITMTTRTFRKLFVSTQWSSLYIEAATKVEVLIILLTVFQVKTQRDIEVIRTGENCRIMEIELEEYGPNPM